MTATLTRHAQLDDATADAGDDRPPRRPGNERAWKCPGCGRTYCVCSRRRRRTRP